MSRYAAVVLDPAIHDHIARRSRAMAERICALLDAFRRAQYDTRSRRDLEQRLQRYLLQQMLVVADAARFFHADEREAVQEIPRDV